MNDTTDYLNVQRDDLGRVVRLFVADQYTELSPDDAIAIGEQLIRQGRELQTEQSELPSDDEQLTLTEGSDDGTETLVEMFERKQSDDSDPLDIGDVINPDDPYNW